MKLTRHVQFATTNSLIKFFFLPQYGLSSTGFFVIFYYNNSYKLALALYIMELDYRLRLRVLFIPLYGNFMYKNRTLDNEKFMENADELTLRKARMRAELIFTTSVILSPIVLGMGLAEILS